MLFSFIFVEKKKTYYVFTHLNTKYVVHNHKDSHGQRICNF